MLKKFGLQSTKDKDKDPLPRLSSPSNNTPSSAPTSLLHNNNNNNQDKEKKKSHLNNNKKKALRGAASNDSMNSISHAPRPHLPSTVYDPNPFPLDPTQPDGVSRFNAFTKHAKRETREVETIDIEIEETKGFVSGKSRQSVDLQDNGYQHVRVERSREEESDELEVEYELSRRNQGNKNAISKLGAGLKGALIGKTGLGGKSQDKERSGVIKETAGKPEGQEVDAVLQHHLQLQQQQEIHIRQQEQHYQQRYAQEHDVSSRGQRGRPRERQRTRSGPAHHQGRSGQSGGGGGGSGIRGGGRGGEDPSSPSYHKENRDPFSDRRSRVHSLSPPPAPGQEHRGSAAYWSDDREGSHPDDQEQMSPFLPQTSSHQRHPRQQEHYERPRPLSQASDSDSGELSRPARGDRRHSRERNESDRARREVIGGVAGGQRQQSGLYQVTSAASIDRTSSELGEEESFSARNDQRSPQRSVPDRLSRAKEWVASHSKNNSIAAPAPIMDRETALASLPGAFPSRSPHRRSMDSFDDYGVITPPRGSYFVNAGRGGGGYDPRERIAMVDQMRMQELQRSGYRSSVADDDGHYWNRQLDGYEHRDRYRQNRVDYEYDGVHQIGGPYYGYAPGGPDDPDLCDETESTLAPGSAIGGVTKGKSGAEKTTDATKKVAPLQPIPGDEESQELAVAKAPNKKRLILRLISLSSSLLVLVMLIAAAPVSHSSSPFTSAAGLAFHYIVAILSTLVSLAFVFNYFSRRLRRQEKMKRYLLFGLDILMSILWLIDAFICISKFPCAVGGQNGWCDMYNTSIFLGIVAFLSFLAAIIWDIWGSFDHSDSKLFGTGPLIKPAPAGWDRKALARQGGAPGSGGAGARQQLPKMPPGAWPGQQEQQSQGVPGQGGAPAKKPKNSKALW